MLGSWALLNWLLVNLTTTDTDRKAAYPLREPLKSTLHNLLLLHHNKAHRIAEIKISISDVKMSVKRKSSCRPGALNYFGKLK